MMVSIESELIWTSIATASWQARFHDLFFPTSCDRGALGAEDCKSCDAHQAGQTRVVCDSKSSSNVRHPCICELFRMVFLDRNRDVMAICCTCHIGHVGVYFRI